MTGSLGGTLCELVIFAHIDEVRDLSAFEPGFRLGDRAFLHPTTCGLHQLQESFVVLHPGSIDLRGFKRGLSVPSEDDEMSVALPHYPDRKIQPFVWQQRTTVPPYPSTAPSHGGGQKKRCSSWHRLALLECDAGFSRSVREMLRPSD